MVRCVNNSLKWFFFLILPFAFGAFACAPVACTPTTLNTGNYATGIDRVQFVDIDNAHTANDNDGLSDFSCSTQAVVTVGETNVLTITLNNGNPEYCQVYIDFDNSGTFESGEKVYDSAPVVSGVHTTNLVVSDDVTPDTLLRMRVMSDYSPIGGACSDVDYGEIEDYGVYVTPGDAATNPPVVINPSVRNKVLISDATIISWFVAPSALFKLRFSNCEIISLAA